MDKSCPFVRDVGSGHRSIAAPLDAVRLRVEHAIRTGPDTQLTLPARRHLADSWAEGTFDPPADAVVERLEQRADRLDPAAVIVLDDEIATGGTLIELFDRLRERGARRLSVACTHGLFTGPAIERLGAREDLDEIVTTNTVPIPLEKRLPNMTVLSIAPLLAEAIRRIHNGESISSMFAERT